MVSALCFSQLVLIALLWLRLMLHWAWSSDRATARLIPPHPMPPRRTRSREPKPLAGLTRKPHCDVCEHTSAPAHTPLQPRIVMTRGRRREIDTSRYFCPNPDWASRGWVGWGNLRAHGRP